jgi:diguanylate cyclase (GGDEF)-like protein
VYLANEIERSRRFGHPLTLAYLDIDHFKEVNDRAGHAAGDRVLVGLTSVAQASTRSIDMVARIGGDDVCRRDARRICRARLPRLVGA